MEQNDKILALCESCINTLRTALTADLPINISMALNQKLFLLETGLEDLQSALTSTPAETSILTAEVVTEVTSALPYAYYMSKATTLKDAVTAFEKDIILNAIQENGSKRKAAAALGMDHSTLIKKCQRYGI